MVLDLVIILALILVNGVLAMSEMSVVASRKARLRQAAEEKRAGAASALALAEDPGRMLSTVQIGITLIGTLAGAFGGATLSAPVAALLVGVPGIDPAMADNIAFGVVVVLITYFSLILGELVPKRLALGQPESLARRLAPMLKLLAKVASPLVWLLSKSTELVLALIPGQQESESGVTDEEIRLLMQEGAQAGHFQEAERQIVDMTLRLGDRRIAALMTPRPQIEWLDLDESEAEILKRVVESHRSRFPVRKGSANEVLGFVQVKDLLAQRLAGQALDLQALLRPVLYIPETAPALQAVERFRGTGNPLALIVDEYGDIQGLVTLNDMLEGLIGDLPEPAEDEGPSVVRREDGSYLVDGTYSVDQLWSAIGMPPHQPDDGAEFHTLGGLVMHCLKKIPTAGDHFTLAGFRLEVMDMDGRRVDKVLISPPSAEAE
ncbi:hemolysin family protein [Zavarzinia sp. CC-PAN008]|uniref:hemolysin family protein n=1 Tax=Zavarzinia sp. CC-PAN008 TaxID=3243332 RepID=UPI003F74AB50